MDESQRLQSQLIVLNEQVDDKYGTIIDEILPSFKTDYSKLKQDIAVQKEEKTLMARELTKLKKEIALGQQRM
jgi:hypothetical protein